VRQSLGGKLLSDQRCGFFERSNNFLLRWVKAVVQRQALGAFQCLANASNSGCRMVARVAHAHLGCCESMCWICASLGAGVSGWLSGAITFVWPIEAWPRG